MVCKVRQNDATAAVAGSLIALGNLYQVYGPLPGNTILAFTADGEAHWFRIRRREDL